MVIYGHSIYWSHEKMENRSLQAYWIRSGHGGVIRWWMRLHRWKWNDVHRRLRGRNGRWTRPAVDGIELFNIASVPVTRYRYRGVKIPNPWNQLNHA